MARISPIILLVIVILAIAFFALGLLIQLLIRCLMKRPSSFSLNSSQSNSRLVLQDDASYNSHTFQRQYLLQHLFRLHDSGLDRALIDALPVFHYKDIMGMGLLRELFDCAVCLSEFSDADKLKFLPNCSHAFHIHCIETWLLSNSTCPLCRSLIGDNTNTTTTMGNPLLSFGDPMGKCNLSCGVGAYESFSQENARGPARVFSVRLGKFKNPNEGLDVSSSSSSIDARRCYSMGAFQYVVDDGVDLQVAMSSGNGTSSGTKAEARCTIERCNDNNIEGMRMNSRSRDDSFSVSKIWLWSKKGKFSSLSDANENAGVLPMSGKSDLV